MNTIKNKLEWKDKSILIFGAGKIGRSFIGQLFSLGGYNVVFADISIPVITELNKRKKYEIVIRSAQGTEDILLVENVRAVDIRNKKQMRLEISRASVLAVSVGRNAIPEVLPVIAEGLIERFRKDKSLAVDIILAENMLDASTYFKEGLIKYLPVDYPLNQLVGLVETSIGKMVPEVPQKLEREDILKVYAEPYNTLILDRNAFKNPIPPIEGLAPKDNIKAWVDRKLFIHNLGHAATAYWGYFYNPEMEYIWQALEVDWIYETVKKTMLQAANLLVKKYHGEFTENELIDHVEDLLERFQNKALGDTIYRVGCDLPRKLGSNDRIAGAIKLAVFLHLPYDYILHTLFVAFRFRAKNEQGFLHPSDEAFIEIYKKGIPEVLKTVCGFNETSYPFIYRKANSTRKYQDGNPSDGF